MNPAQISESMLRAGMKLSSRVAFSDLNEGELQDAAQVDAEQFREVFGDLDTYLHVMEQRLSDELAEALRSALFGLGSQSQRLNAAIDVFLDMHLARRGAHDWVRQQSHRSAPLKASLRKHCRIHARILESGFSDTSTPLAQAQARMLVAALRETARAEGIAGCANPDLRESLFCFARTCSAAPRPMLLRA